MDEVPYTWDANGNLLSDGVNTYTFDSANRLVSVTNATNTSSYAYNGLGDRLQETVNGQTTTYLLDLAVGLTQVLSDGSLDYIYGLDLIAQMSGTDVDYFLGDALGSVRQLMDGSGMVTLAKSYDPFGVAVSSAGSATTSFGFTGEQQSQGLVYLRARYYNPAMGRFQSRDTWGGDINNPMSYNAWMYVYGNPLLLVDPNGRFPIVLGPLGLAVFKNYDEVNGHWNENNDPIGYSEDEMRLIEAALWNVGKAYAHAYNLLALREFWCLPPAIRNQVQITRIDPLSALLMIHGGKITFYKWDWDDASWYGQLDENGNPIKPLGQTAGSNIIWIYPYGEREAYFAKYDNDHFTRFIVHEMGHAFDNAMNSGARSTLGNSDLYNIYSDLDVYHRNGFYGNEDEGWQRRGNPWRSKNYELFADMFIGWVYDKWEVDPDTARLTSLGQERRTFMKDHMPKWIERKLGSPLQWGY